MKETSTMNKTRRKRRGMRSEYDFSGGVRGKYARRYSEGTNVILLDPDVRDVFRDSKSANQALRAIAKLVRSRAG